MQLLKAAPFSGDKTPRLHPIRWHHLPGRPQAGSYVVQIPRLVKFCIRDCQVSRRGRKIQPQCID
ncbi:MAG TPA: hypothetical protein DIW77_04305 [Chromatiaceae bacterium]|nr:hypothetical protein [Chromatiaceae bacterium]